MKSESLWTACKSCGMRGSSDAKVCTNCGAKRARHTVLKWVGGLLAVTIIAAIFAPKSITDSSESAAQKNPKSLENSIVQPDDQVSFIAVINDYAEGFRKVTNELQASSLRDQRRLAIAQTLDSTLRVRGWTGELTRLETNSEGNAIIAVRLSPAVKIVTWSNALSDLTHGTLIKKGTPLYDKLSQMAVGKRVSITGQFIQSDRDGIWETSITLRGSMTNPNFLFQFDGITEL